MHSIVAILALLLTGPLVGFEFCVAAVVNPLAAALPDDGFRSVRSRGSRLLGTAMPFWYAGVLALLIAGAVITPRGLTIAAIALMVSAVLLTVVVLVPINTRIGKWSSDDDVERDLAARWDRFHWLRVALLAAVFTLLAMSLG